jgi:hypothetical protein
LDLRKEYVEALYKNWPELLTFHFLLLYSRPPTKLPQFAVNSENIIGGSNKLRIRGSAQVPEFLAMRN